MVICRTTPYELEVMWTSAERKNHHLPQVCCDSSRWHFDDPNFVTHLFFGIEVVSENEQRAMRLIISESGWRR
jgi:hypothetical protein